MCKIIEVLPCGCLMIVGPDDVGLPYIEVGDHERAKELLSSKDYAKACALWTPEVVAARQAELEQQADMMAICM